MNQPLKKKFFRIALKEAQRAFDKAEVPIGAVIVQNGKILAKAHNSTESKNSHLAHAEILAIQRASKKRGSKYLPGCDLYITLEPCQMCRAAAKLARIDNIYYALPSAKFGRRGLATYKTKIRKVAQSIESESQDILARFFLILRAQRKLI